MILQFRNKIEQINILLNNLEFEEAKSKAEKYIIDENYKIEGIIIIELIFIFRLIATESITTESEKKYFFDYEKIKNFNQDNIVDISKVICDYLLFYFEMNNIESINLNDIEMELVKILENSDLDLSYLKDDYGRKGKYVLAIIAALVHLNQNSKRLGFVWNRIFLK